MDIKQAAFDILILRAAEHRFSQNKRCQLDGVGSRGSGLGRMQLGLIEPLVTRATKSTDQEQ